MSTAPGRIGRRLLGRRRCVCLCPRQQSSSSLLTPHHPQLSSSHSGSGLRQFATTTAVQQTEIKYTTDSYDVKRNTKLASVTADDVAFFKSVLGGGGVIDGVTRDDANIVDDLEVYNRDWMNKYRGHTRLVLRPKSVEEVSKVLKHCNDRKLAVVPQGGNTGLVGGSVPVFDEIVITLGRMNKIRSFDDVSGILVVDAGVILEIADNFLAEHGYVFPLDLGAKGSCQIGGNVATNAGGLRVLRYGSLHGNVLGLEAVLPDGTILNDLTKLKKNNTGYDLKQLFIGGEGSIGIITGLSVACPQRSSATNIAYFGLQSYEHVQQAFKAAKKGLGEILSAFEMMDGKSQDLVAQVTGKRRPLEDRYPFYCVVETSGSNMEHDKEKLSQFLEHVLGEEIVTDGVLAENETQLKDLWSWREGITEAMGHIGPTYKYDVSIPINKLYQLVEDCQACMKEKGLLGEPDDKSKPIIHILGFGHMGDGNLHLNIVVRHYSKEVEQALEPWVYEWIQQHQGSISAEHGLGLAKRKFIAYSKDKTMVKLIQQIKNLYDPNGIMNPYKYIDAEAADEHSSA